MSFNKITRFCCLGCRILGRSEEKEISIALSDPSVQQQLAILPRHRSRAITLFIYLTKRQFTDFTDANLATVWLGDCIFAVDISRSGLRQRIHRTAKRFQFSVNVTAVAVFQTTRMLRDKPPRGNDYVRESMRCWADHGGRDDVAICYTQKIFISGSVHFSLFIVHSTASSTGFTANEC